MADVNEIMLVWTDNYEVFGTHTIWHLRAPKWNPGSLGGYRRGIRRYDCTLLH